MPSSVYGLGVSGGHFRGPRVRVESFPWGLGSDMYTWCKRGLIETGIHLIIKKESRPAFEAL